ERHRARRRHVEHRSTLHRRPRRRRALRLQRRAAHPHRAQPPRRFFRRARRGTVVARRRIAMSHERSHFSRFGLVLLALLALGWGFNWPIMKIVLQEVPPLTFRGVCLVAGSLGILLIARLVNEPLTIPRAYCGRLALL